MNLINSGELIIRVCDAFIYFVRMRRLFLILDTIDILCLVYSNFFRKWNNN